jgi:hypothetical protein
MQSPLYDKSNEMVGHLGIEPSKNGLRDRRTHQRMHVALWLQDQQFSADQFVTHHFRQGLPCAYLVADQGYRSILKLGPGILVREVGLEPTVPFSGRF